MILYVCDLCQQKFEKGQQRVRVNAEFPLKELMLCAKCAQPILNFLNEKGLGQKEAPKIS